MMSEFSMKLHSKKGAARIQKAQKFLSDVKSEENKIIRQIQEIAKPAADSYERLVQSKGTPSFTKTYGSCLVTLQDTLSKLQDISRLLDEDSDGEESGEDTTEPAEECDGAVGGVGVKVEVKEEPPDPEDIPSLQINQVNEEVLVAESVHPQLTGNDEPEELHTEQAVTALTDTGSQGEAVQAEHTKDKSHLFYDKVQSLYQTCSLKLEEMMDVTCGFHQGPNYLWLQPSPTVVDRIAENICLGLSNQMYPPLTKLPSIGEVVLAKYTLDDFYYRAVVKSIAGEPGEEMMQVFFIDYGNIETSPLSGLLDIGVELSSLPPQACLCTLDFVSPPVALGRYTDKTMTWFEEHINEKIKAKFYLCDEECPIVLAKVYCNNKDMTTEMIYNGYAVRVASLTFRDKYEKMTAEIKEFYLSVQPQFSLKKEKVVTPNRPIRTPSSSGTPSKLSKHSSGPFGTKQNKASPMPAEAVGSIREDMRRELHAEQKRKIQSTIRANEQIFLKSFASDMAKKSQTEESVELEDEWSTTEPGAAAAGITAGITAGISEPAVIELQPSDDGKHTVTQQPTDDSSTKTMSTSQQKPADDKKLVDDDTLRLLKSAYHRLCGPEFQRPKSAEPQESSAVRQAQAAKAVVRNRNCSSSIEEPQNAAAHRMIKNSLGLSTSAEVERSASHNESQQSGAKPNTREYIDERRGMRYSSESSYKNAGSKSRSVASGRTATSHSTHHSEMKKDSDPNLEEKSWNLSDSWAKQPLEGSKQDTRLTFRSNSQPAVDQITTCTLSSGTWKLDRDTPSSEVKVVPDSSTEESHIPPVTSTPDKRRDGTTSVASTQQDEISSSKIDNPSQSDSTSDKEKRKNLTQKSQSGDNVPTTNINSAQQSTIQIKYETVQQMKSNEITFVDAPNAIKDASKTKSSEPKPDIPQTAESLSKIDAADIPLPPTADNSSDISLHGGRSISHGSLSADVSPAQRHSSGEANTEPDKQVDKAKKHEKDELDVSVAPQHGDTTPECLLSPPKCQGSAQVPAQTLEITDTSTPRRALISHINTPTDLYVNLCDKKTAMQFSQVLENIGEYYDRIFNSMLRTMIGDYKPKIGDYCVAKSDQFGSYYRAEILDFRDSKDVLIDDMVVRKRNSKTVKAFFIDYGSSEWVSEDSVFPLMPQFGSVPPLAWHCSLTDVFPLEGCKAEYPGGWDRRSVDAVKELLVEGSVCEMYLTNPRKQMVNEVLQVILMIPQSPTNEGDAASVIYVNEKLVEMGVAHSHFLQGEDNSAVDISAVADTSAPEVLGAAVNQAGSDIAVVHDDTNNGDDISKWNPMADDFYSHTNMYSLNPDDAEVVLTGYKSQEPERARCRDFARTGACRRGDNCPYDHITEREGAVTEDKKEVFCTDTTISLPIEGSYVVAELTAVMSPSHFYLILPFGSKSINEIVGAETSDSASSQGGYTDPITEAEEEDFASFQQSLNDHYSSQPFIRNDSIAYASGEVVVAKFTLDDTFYRARVVDSDFDNQQVMVFFVDFGNVEWTSHSNIREMLPRFLHLPFQAIECFLDVIPAGDKSDWTQEEIDYFSQLAEAKYLICKPKYCNKGANCMNVELIDANSGSDIWIDQALVEAGIAQKSDKPINSSTVSSPSQEKVSPYLPG